MSTTENIDPKTERNASQPPSAPKSELKPCVLCEIVVPELQEEIQRLKNKIKKLYLEA